MNESQNKMYWILWSQCSRKLKASGKTAAQIDALRKRIHFRIGAYWFKAGKLILKSSKHLNNRDLDQVKAVFLSISRANDLQAQLDQLEMPAVRIMHAAAELLDTIGIEADQDKRKAYLAGVARKPLADCDDDDLQRVIIALNHTAMHKTGKEHNHPQVGKGPQSRFAHRVGHNKNQPEPITTTETNRVRETKYKQAHLGI